MSIDAEAPFFCMLSTVPISSIIPVNKDLWADVGLHLLDDACTKSRPVETASAFKKDAVDLFFSQLFHQ